MEPPMCRICKDIDNTQSLIKPCDCNDPIHLECLHKWIGESERSTCEVCTRAYCRKSTNRITFKISKALRIAVPLLLEIVFMSIFLILNIGIDIGSIYDILRNNHNSISNMIVHCVIFIIHGVVTGIVGIRRINYVNSLPVKDMYRINHVMPYGYPIYEMEYLSWTYPHIYELIHMILVTLSIHFIGCCWFYVVHRTFMYNINTLTISSSMLSLFTIIAYMPINRHIYLPDWWFFKYSYYVLSQTAPICDRDKQ